MTSSSMPHVDLGMYPFESVGWAWEQLWAAVHERAPWTPSELLWSGDVHARWDDPDCAVTQICGGPLAVTYRDDFEVVGAFSLNIAEAVPHTAQYQTVIMSTTDAPLAERDFANTHVVANSADSLSGWHSLRAATAGAGAAWPGTVTFTSAHRDSLALLGSGRGELASIDPWSLSFIEAEQPELVQGLHRVGVGPVIPTPAVVVRTGVTGGTPESLPEAFDQAVADPHLTEALAALHIQGFVQVGLDDYLSIGTLAANA